ncbi:MAG: glycoside hydrolase family 13 protein [Candidatus Eremiobacteraeota bacterium]|nr:glycoside hydrolase family 13 protein [Candidatus Eremiobacteraeota bacterium]
MKRVVLIIILALPLIMNYSFAAETPQAGDGEWKKSWYVNATWYQIFPDRFYNALSKNDPLFSPHYDRQGRLLPQRLSPWTDQKPTNISKYGGDLEGIKEKLPYLHELGISAIWLNPVFAATSNHRYNTSDYRLVDGALGTGEDLAGLIEKAHRMDIRVILDGVFNHTGYEFWAFQDIVARGRKSPYREWYSIKSYPVRKLWEQSPSKKPNYECWWGVGSLPKLNHDNADVRAHLYEITKKWMALGIDGWRLDVPEEIKNDRFWSEWCALVKSVNKDAYISGEIWGEGAAWVNDGTRFDGLMNYYGFRDPALKYFAGRKITVSEFDRLLAERRALYPHRVNCAMQNLLSSHDTARFLSALQNGDEKDSDKEKKSYDKSPAKAETVRRFKVAVLFQMTYVGCPMLYYGDEIGMTGGKDPDCRRPMQWDPALQNRELLSWHRRLIALRSAHQCLRTGDFETLIKDDERDIYGYRRLDGGETLAVIINYSGEGREVTLPGAPASSVRDLITGREFFPSAGGLSMTLMPWSGVVLKGI